MTVRVWSLTQKNEEAIFKGHESVVTGIVITSNNQFIVSGSADKTFRIWSLRDKTNVSVLQGNDLLISACIAITSDDKYIVYGSFDTVRLWNFQEELALTRDSGWVQKFSRMFGTKHRREIKISSGDYLRVHAIAISSDNQYIVTGSGNHPIEIWSFKDLKEIGALEGHTHPVGKVGITSDKNYIISADNKNIVRIWSIQNKRHEAVFKDSEEAYRWNSEYPEISEFFN